MSEWISVYDKKPEIGQYALCFLEDNLCAVLKYRGDYDFVPDIPYDNDYLMYNTLSRVTHWMPLPKPPEPKS